MIVTRFGSRSTAWFMAGLLLYAHAVYGYQADNGNGTFTNPLFYDEFSDPDLIRVGDDFYMTGTTMHSMPGLPVLHSRDLVNWQFLSYACDKLDLGPQFRLENGGSVYGQGIWAPCFRHHNGIFYIFSNVNGHHTQMFTATDPSGPWTHTQMKQTFHDLSVLFDDDGTVYVLWGHDGIHLAQLNKDLMAIVPGTQQLVIEPGSGMGEGSHFYKIDGRYYITSARSDGHMSMPCARADSPEGPYEFNRAISIDEEFGLAEGCRLKGRRPGPPFDVIPANTKPNGRMSLHQGGIVQTPKGEWWGFSMMDYNSAGRLTALSPITWKDGWPYFGLPGNLKRTPRTWVKPDTGHQSAPRDPYERNDDFSDSLANVWQWNHIPDDSKWSLKERPGFVRLHSLPAANLWHARNTLTQRGIGPVSIPTVELDVSGLKSGDVAGLALMNLPYAWIGVKREGEQLNLLSYNQYTDQADRVSLKASRVWLRAHCDFLTEQATFSFSTDGRRFESLGSEFTMIFQIITFQGVRYSLFNFNTSGQMGGYADFDRFIVDEVYPRGLMRPIPLGKTISFAINGKKAVLGVEDSRLRSLPMDDPIAPTPASLFKVVDRGLGRVALQWGSRFISVAGREGPVGLKAGEPGDAETFQWIENVYGDLILMCLRTHCYLRVTPDNHITVGHPGPLPDRKDGSCFTWQLL